MSRSSTLILVLLAVIAAGFFLEYISRPPLLSRGPGLEFSHFSRNLAECMNQSRANVAEARWIGNNKMHIQALGLFVNCACSVGSGGYRVDGDKIILQYEEICNRPKDESCSICEELIYEIKDLERKDYTFEMERITLSNYL